MKLITYSHEGKNKVGAVDGHFIVDLSGLASNMLGLIELGQAGLTLAQDLIDASENLLPLESTRLMAPIPNPQRNVMCLGLNYAEHAAEHYSFQGKQADLPEFPIIFTKATTTVNGPYDEIPFDPQVSEKIDWEVELAVIIGKAGKNITRDEAMAHVFGYTVINDISARDLQNQHKQFFKGKSLDGACPMGPWIVTVDEVPDPHDLRIKSKVNDQTKQESTTSLMLFNIPDIIYHLSRGMSLQSGDIIATGTPSGVGFARKPPEFLKPGDSVQCEVQDVGFIRNVISSPIEK